MNFIYYDLFLIFFLLGPLSGKRGRLNTDIAITAGDKSVLTAQLEPIEPYPKDEHNILLEHHVHPADYINPSTSDEYDMVVIGAGVSGLISIIIGTWLGKKCALIEKHAMGGDCLNTGKFKEYLQIFRTMST